AVNALVAPSRGSSRGPRRAGPSRLSASAARQKAYEAAIPPGTKRKIQSTSTNKNGDLHVREMGTEKRDCTLLLQPPANRRSEGEGSANRVGKMRLREAAPRHTGL